METVQQNGRFTLFSTKFHSSIYSILFGSNPHYHYLENGLHYTALKSIYILNFIVFYAYVHKCMVVVLNEVLNLLSNRSKMYLFKKPLKNYVEVCVSVTYEYLSNNSRTF